MRHKNTPKNIEVKTLTHDGKTLPIREWAEITGISECSIEGRMKRGWDIKRTLTEPQRAVSANRRRY